MRSEAAAGRCLRVGSSEYPVVGPRVNDPRLHVAAVIITIHVLGQLALDFRVSVLHIIASIGVCFLIEVSHTFVLDRRLVWPASAMLTGSGVALILRLPDAEANAPWATDGWQVYVIVSALSVASKYLIRFRGNHVFNPSNLVLVATFVILGSGRVEPLDFWWAPMGPAMAFAYAVIAVGGMLIVRQLGLFGIVVGFWAGLAVGLGAVAFSGHCIAALWDPHPVCGGHFWWVVLTSPETMVFLFFMITDPRTVPATASGRRWFGISVACVSTLLMAPQATEFGAKVGLLGGLVVCSALRPVVVLTSESRWVRGVSSLRRAVSATTGGVAQWLAAVLVVTFVSFVAVLAGASARTIEQFDPAEIAELIDPTGVLPAVDLEVLPLVEVDPEVLRFDESLDDDGARQLAAEVLWLLQVEDEAVGRQDSALVRSVSQGRRRTDALERIDIAERTGVATALVYHFESLRLVLVRAGQGGVRLGFEARGSRHETDVAQTGAVISRNVEFEEILVLLGPANGRWFLFDTLPIDS